MPTRSASVALACLLALGTVLGAGDFPMLTPEKCATLANAPPSEPILERERCSICKVITDNARLWNWVQHYSSLCYGVPPHAQEWVSRLPPWLLRTGAGCAYIRGRVLGRWGGAVRGGAGSAGSWRGVLDART